MHPKNWKFTALAAFLGGLDWVWIPLVYAAYPWGAAGNRAYGHFDYLLFVGPLLFTAAMPGLFRYHGQRMHQRQRTGFVIAFAGGALLTIGSFGYAFGHMLIGHDVPSPGILLPVLIISAGFMVLSTRIVRAGSWANWDGLTPIAIGVVPLLWLLVLMSVGLLLGPPLPESAMSRFFEASFTTLIVSFGSVWMFQAFALRLVSRRRKNIALDHR